MNKLDNLSLLKDPFKVRGLLNHYSEDIFGLKSEIREVSILILQLYQDEVSYNATFRYTLTARTSHNKTVRKELTATSGWPVSNKYEYVAGGTIFKALNNKPAIIKTPEYYAYIARHNLVLREYLSGMRLSKEITEKKLFKPAYARILMGWLSEFQKIKPLKNYRDAINLNDLESNLKILERTNNPKAKLINREYSKIKGPIISWSRRYNKTLVHGDFNPANILLDKNHLTIIDFEGTHRGDRITDPANLSAYISILLKKSGANDDKIDLAEKEIISAYEKVSKNLNTEERERFYVYRKYFTFLFEAYELVWS